MLHFFFERRSLHKWKWFEMCPKEVAGYIYPNRTALDQQSQKMEVNIQRTTHLIEDVSISALVAVLCHRKVIGKNDVCLWNCEWKCSCVVHLFLYNLPNILVFLFSHILLVFLFIAFQILFLMYVWSDICIFKFDIMIR